MPTKASTKPKAKPKAPVRKSMPIGSNSKTHKAVAGFAEELAALSARFNCAVIPTVTLAASVVETRIVVAANVVKGETAEAAQQREADLSQALTALCETLGCTVSVVVVILPEGMHAVLKPIYR